MNRPHLILLQVNVEGLYEPGVKPGPIYLTNLETLKEACAAVCHSCYFVEVSAVVAEEFEFDKSDTVYGFAIAIGLAGKPISELRANVCLIHAPSSPTHCLDGLKIPTSLHHPS